MPIITGTSGGYSLTPGNPNDELEALGGNDNLFLIHADVRARGGQGNDRFFLYEFGARDIEGGDGYDTLSIEAIGPTLTPTVTGVFSGIEHIVLIGERFALTGHQFATGFAANGLVSGVGQITVNLGPGNPFQGQRVVIDPGSIGAIGFTINGGSNPNQIKAVLDAVNTVNGGGSNDQIRGGRLGDVINGGGGNDKIIGFTGSDVLTGGAGADQFRYLFATDSGLGAESDHITDFLAGTDRINFSQLDADPLTAGRQRLTFVGTGDFSASGAAELRYEVIDSDLLVSADLDGDGLADMEIWLDNAAAGALTGGDFML